MAISPALPRQRPPPHQKAAGAFLPLASAKDAGRLTFSGIESSCPFSRERLGLLQYVLHRRILQVGRIAVFAQPALYMSPDVGSCRVPIYGQPIAVRDAWETPNTDEPGYRGVPLGWQSGCRSPRHLGPEDFKDCELLHA
jgi:hypothetical protein